jgi:dolichol-phosphate mannosyltransferase
MSPKIAVMPTYNERENLPKLVGMLAESAVPDLHVLVVDDNSPDGTGDVADGLANKAPDSVGVLHRTEKNGLGRAYVAGITRALDEGADIVIQMDADLSHPV